jgi:hypothetical protein
VFTSASTDTTEASTYFFTPRELERLTIYRAAIAAEFYTDRCELSSPPSLQFGAFLRELPLRS